ncbi:MAG: Fe-S cluster assembly ATPase SufC [Candidatus Micrarchaeota archaeon]
MFTLDKLTVSFRNKVLIDSISLRLQSGHISVIMGPNGSGKSTLCKAIMGHPDYSTKGKILFDNMDISKMNTSERAKLGMFMTFQEPPPVDGVNLMNIISKMNSGSDLILLKNKVVCDAKELGLGEGSVDRSVNVGFSGGEKKRSELLQLLHSNPKLVLLDEIDSGLDVDGFKVLVRILLKLKAQGATILVITHQTRLLKCLSPDRVFLMKEGKLFGHGGNEVIDEIDKNGFKCMESQCCAKCEGCNGCIS